MASRVIRFRAWDKNHECFVPNFYWYLDPIGRARWVDDDSEAKDLVIQQSTGLYDKKNQEIYEGDLVKINKKHIAYWLQNAPEYSCGEIAFVNTSFSVRQKMIGRTELNDFVFCDCCPCGLEVIGNIFKNPELLKNEK